MPRRDTEQRLRDILTAIGKIRRYTDGMDAEAFAADEKTIDAVLRNLSVIGEAASHVPEDFGAGHPHVPWAEMRGMRNVVIHEYFGVSLAIVWQTLQQDLPALEDELRTLLARNG